MIPRIDTGSNDGSGPDERETTDSGTVDAGSTGGGGVGTIDTGGNQSVDRDGPQNHSYPGGTSGTETDRTPVHTPGGDGDPSDTISTSSGDTETRPTNHLTSAPVGPQETVTVNGETFVNGTPEDPDYMTQWEDADMFPKGSAANPIDPIDNPQEFNETDNDPNRIDLGQGPSGIDPDNSEATSVDSDPTSPGGGQTHVTDGPDANTSSDSAQQTATDHLADESADAPIDSGVVNAMDPQEVADAAQNAGETVRERLEENSDLLGAAAAVVSLGSVAFAATRNN